jgi:tetratricopeptide (TPR) repeat protein
MRRDSKGARKHLERALLLAPAGEHRAWVLASPAYAAVLLELGDPLAARDVATRTIEQARTLDLDRNAELYAGRVLALCQSRLGEHELAASQLNQTFELAREIELAGLPFAPLYEAQAEIELAAGNSVRYEHALRSLARLVRDAEAPALTARAHALQEQGRRRSQAPPAGAAAPELGHQAERSVIDAVHTALSSYPSRRQRATHALRLLLEDCHARDGLLFLLEENRPMLAASTIARSESQALLDFVEQYLSAESLITESVTTLSENTDALESAISQGLWTDESDNRRYMPVLLWNRDDEHSVIAGLALIATPGPDLRTPQPELAWAISSCLREVRDTLTITVQR